MPFRPPAAISSIFVSSRIWRSCLLSSFHLPDTQGCVRRSPTVEFGCHLLRLRSLIWLEAPRSKPCKEVCASTFVTMSQIYAFLFRQFLDRPTGSIAGLDD